MVSSEIASPNLPEFDTTDQIVAQITSASPMLRGLYLSFDHQPAKRGLSTTVYADLQNDQNQLLGLVNSKATLSKSTKAKTQQGVEINCAQLPSQHAQLQKTQRLNYLCGGMNVSITLTREKPSQEKITQALLEKSLRSGATTKSSMPQKNIELTIDAQKIVVFKNDQLFQSKLTQQQFSHFIHNRQSISFRSAPKRCTVNCAAQEEGFSVSYSTTEGLLMTHTTSENSLVERVSLNKAGKLQVASYNVENLWDHIADNSLPYDDFSAEKSNWYSDKMAFNKAQRIAQALLAAGLPDVVGLQEIESASNNSQSLELLKPILAPMGYNHYALGIQSDTNPTAVTTAVISKYPIAENSRLDFLFAPSELTEEEKENFIGASRDPQRVTIVLPEGKHFSIINSHWKSKRDKSPWGDVMRQELATLIREHVNALKAKDGTPMDVLVMGDFNADYRESPVQEGLNLARSISEARRQPQGNKLVPLWLTLPPSSQGDYPHDSHLQALDNIVITSSLLKSAGLTLAGPLDVIGRKGYAAEILSNGDGLPLRSQLRKFKDSNGEMRTTHFNDGFSDHLPIVATFVRNTSSSSAEKVPPFENSIEEQTIELLPALEISGAPCSESENPITDISQILQFQRGECVVLSDVALPLHKTGLFNIYFNVNNPSSKESSLPVKVVITADRAFGVNKNWLRGVLQSSEGRTLKKLRGRVGVVEGHKAIFIHSPASDIGFLQ